MRLIDEEVVEKQKIKTQKTKRMIIITIVLLLLLCSGIQHKLQHISME